MKELNGQYLDEEQLRSVISDYLDEMLRYYQERQRTANSGAGSEREDRLEQKAAELLNAMNASDDPTERRKALLQVLRQARQHRGCSLPS